MLLCSVWTVSAFQAVGRSGLELSQPLYCPSSGHTHTHTRIRDVCCKVVSLLGSHMHKFTLALFAFSDFAVLFAIPDVLEKVAVNPSQVFLDHPGGLYSSILIVRLPSLFGFVN